jgi:hypothetical protein
MVRGMAAGVLLMVGSVSPAFGKALCPSGEFTVIAPGAALDGETLVLGQGSVEVAGRCGPVRGGVYRSMNGRGWWLALVRAQWRKCDGRRLKLRAEWDFSERYCSRLSGKLRVGARQRIAFVADRVSVCGNGLREPGEQCDGDEGTLFNPACCMADCQLAPDCPTICDADFPCGADELCHQTCGWGGSCVPRSEVSCDDGPVCGCDLRTTFSSACAAYEAGTGIARKGACSVP